MPDTILVVEDESALPDTLIYNLKKDGFEVARILSKEIPTPILMLTARDDEIDRVGLTTISGGVSPSKLPLLSCDPFIISEPLDLHFPLGLGSGCAARFLFRPLPLFPRSSHR